MIVDSIYNVGDTVWAMRDNYPTEFIIAGLKFDSGVIGSDRYNNSEWSKQDQEIIMETTVKYYLVPKIKVNLANLKKFKEGKTVFQSDLFENHDVNPFVYYKKSLFNTKEELVYSLLK